MKHCKINVTCRKTKFKIKLLKENSIKEKTVNGLFWNVIETFGNQGIQFLIGLILARLLSPREYGLIGMIIIFITLSQSLVDSGFGGALIRKKDCDQADYSTIFFFNIIVSSFLFLTLFCLASPISAFFAEPQLKSMLQVLSLAIIFNALSLIQQIILTKKLDFRLQSKISFIATVGSGIIAIIMALYNFGVWSLVALTVCRSALHTIFLWVFGRWNPSLIFSIKAFTEMFNFGSKLLLSGLLNTFTKNIYYLIIGKFFSASQLGYFSRADQFKSIFSSNINLVVGRVTFPVLASLQDDIGELKLAYKKLIRSMMFITFSLMFGLAAVAEPLIVTLLGYKWIESAFYLQLLCFSGALYPINALNLNILKIRGKSGKILKLVTLNNLLIIPVVFIGITYGIEAMIIAMIVNALITFIINSSYSGIEVNYSLKEQVADILPSFLLTALCNFLVFMSGKLISINSGPKLIFQVCLGVLLVVFISEIFRFRDYVYLKNVILKNKVFDNLIPKWLKL